MAKLLEGRSILVTGGAQEGGIGDAIARRCAEHGAHVHVLSRSASGAKAAAERHTRAGLHATGHACEITEEASVHALARSLDRVDGIVHNAGLPVTEWSRAFAEIPMEDFRKAFEVDVLGAARLTRAFLPQLTRQGGSLVFTSSTAAIAGYEHLHEFSPAKAGVLGLMRGLAAELGRHKVRSNAVAYGNISSPATWDVLDEAQRDALAREAPMRRWGSPREAAGASVFLLSELSSFMTGQVLVIDGGTVMR